MLPVFIRKYFRYLSIAKMDFITVFIVLSVITTSVIALCSPILFWAEASHESANVKTFGDAIWLSFMIVTTIGFGDFYPVSTLGRLIAVPLAATGIGVFGTLAGYFGSMVLNTVIRQTTTDMLHEQNKRIEELSHQNKELNETIHNIAHENKELNKLIVQISEQNEAINRKIEQDTQAILAAVKHKQN